MTSAASPTIRILIVDDHPIVREGIAAVINRRLDMTVVAEAGSAEEATALFERLLPDVTLMDLRLPGMSGVDAIRAIRQVHPQARILVLTTYDGDEDIYRALQAGASGYLLKDSQREVLLDTIRSIYAGKKQLAPEVASRLVERIPATELTPRELEVLRGMADGLSNKEIGAALNITEGTVKVHVNSLLGKLNVADRTQAVVQAIKRGLIHL